MSATTGRNSPAWRNRRKTRSRQRASISLPSPCGTCVEDKRDSGARQSVADNLAVAHRCRIGGAGDQHRWRAGRARRLPLCRGGERRCWMLHPREPQRPAQTTLLAPGSASGWPGIPITSCSRIWRARSSITCALDLSKSEVKGLTMMTNSRYNGWRFEDVWLDK